ncbi:MAG: ATP-binding cassette domain-containing protein, partial [Bdellovibrionia bacterium]
MIRLEARSLTKTFGSFKANDSISARFRSGSIHAIVGENGAGKSTLMKTLFGLHRPDSGEILLSGTARNWRTPLDAIANGIGMVQQHFMLVPELTAIDNIILGAENAGFHGVLNRRQAIEAVLKVLPSRKLEVPWLEQVEDLSVGDRQKIEILKLLYRKADVLILDEPTAVLTPQEAEDLFEVLRGLRDAGRTIIIISHKLNEIFAVCDEFTVLRAGRVTGTGLIKDSTRDQVVEHMMGTKLPPLAQERTPARTEKVLECSELRDP